MSKETSVFLLGIIIFFTGFSGLPSEYKEWIFIVSGVLLVVIGYRLRRQAFLKSIEHDGGEKKSEMFAESEQIEEEVLEENELREAT